jgi:hypothetical protein
MLAYLIFILGNGEVNYGHTYNIMQIFFENVTLAVQY